MPIGAKFKIVYDDDPLKRDAVAFILTPEVARSLSKSFAWYADEYEKDGEDCEISISIDCTFISCERITRR